jgi:hypothetical protein
LSTMNTDASPGISTIGLGLVNNYGGFVAMVRIYAQAACGTYADSIFTPPAACVARSVRSGTVPWYEGSIVCVMNSADLIGRLVSHFDVLQALRAPVALHALFRC